MIFMNFGLLKLRKYGKTWAQVALRWIVEQGATFSTQTKSKKHFAEDQFTIHLLCEMGKQCQR